MAHLPGCRSRLCRAGACQCACHDLPTYGDHLAAAQRCVVDIVEGRAPMAYLVRAKQRLAFVAVAVGVSDAVRASYAAERGAA